MILDSYTTFEELVSEINNISDIKIMIDGYKNHNGIRLQGKHAPKSINEHEFNYIHTFIVNNNLKNGYELATGVGISSLAAGIAFSKTGGKLLTLDNYAEEETQEQQLEVHSNSTYKDSDSYRLLKTMISTYNLGDYIETYIGTSPMDTEALLYSYKDEIDYVLLDCPKCDADFERDFTVLWQFMNKDKYAIFVHDSHTFTQKSFDLVQEITGQKMRLIYEFYKGTDNYSKRIFPLALITNIK